MPSIWVGVAIVIMLNGQVTKSAWTFDSYDFCWEKLREVETAAERSPSAVKWKVDCVQLTDKWQEKTRLVPEGPQSKPPENDRNKGPKGPNFV